MKTEFEIAPGITLYIGERPAHFPSDEERTKWTDALRSGRYKQGKQVLKHGDFYCCLGVKEDIEGCNWTPSYLLDGLMVFSNSTGEHYLYTGESQWLNSFGEFPNKTYVAMICNLKVKTHKCLTQLNDHGLTFAQIADIIDIVWNPKTYEQ